MIRRVAFFKALPEAGHAAVQELESRIRAIPQLCEAVRRVGLGAASTNANAVGTWSHMWDLEFADLAGAHAYAAWEKSSLAAVDPARVGSVVERIDYIYFEPGTFGTKMKGLKRPVRRPMMFRMSEKATAAEIKKTEDIINQMPKEIPQIKSWCLSTTAGLPTPTPWTHVREHELESETAVKEYADHPYHVNVVGVHFRELMKSGAIATLSIAWYTAPESFIAP